MSWDLNSERELWADICVHSFWHFCDYALGYGSGPHKWWTPRVHKPFCDWYESRIKEWASKRQVEEDKSTTYLMIVVMREFGKTMIITKAGQLWLHLQDPDISSYTGSATVTRAQDFFEPIKTHLNGSDPNSLFVYLYGNWCDRNRTWTTTEVVHGARIALARSEPSLGTWGVETGLTGTHPDAGFIDDPIDYEIMGKDSRWLEKVNTHLTSLTPVFKANALFVYTGTRYHNADAIGESLAFGGALTLTGHDMPGIVASPEGRWHVYFMPGRGSDGVPIYPENWPEKRLKEFDRQNSLIYAAQILQDPNTGQHVALTRAQIEDRWVDEKDVPRNLLHSLHIDTAFKSRESASRGDWSVITHWGHTTDGTGDVYYLEGYGSNRWRVEDFNDQLIMLLQKLKARKQWPFALTDEQEVGGKYGTWELTIQSWCHGAGLPAPPIKLLSRGGRKKNSRIIQAAAYWVDGHVKLVRSAPGLDNLISQMLQIGTSAHDDWADASADVFHSEVYRPARIAGQRDLQPYLSRPWDRELQVGATLDDFDARKAYDFVNNPGADDRSPQPIF